MRLLRDGWTPDLARAVTDWYEGTRDWKGGYSVVPFLENIYGDCTAGFSLVEKKDVLVSAAKTPQSAIVLAKRQQLGRDLDMLPTMVALQDRLKTAKNVARQDELVAAVSDAITQTALSHLTADTLPLAIEGL